MRFYKFDEFKIDVTKRKFFCDEQEIELRDRDFDVLLFLIEKRNETQSKDEIIKAVWNGTAVEDNSVERAIVNIRKVLGDDASSPWFIKTVRGKGYLFICDVEEFDEEELQSFVESTPTKIVSKNRFPNWLPSAIFSFLLILVLGIVWWNSENLITYLTTETIFSDDFLGEKIDENKWNAEGDSVKSHEGIARISLDKFRNGGKLRSIYFSYNPEKPLTIKSRVRISYNQSIKETVTFIGAFGLVGENSDKDFIGIKYTNAETKFPREGNVTLKGFYMVKDNADLLNENNHCNGKIGQRTDAIWGKWFEQKLIYEPNTGTVKLFIDNEKKGEFAVGKLPVTKENKLRLYINPEGAFLHHAIEIDYIEITQ